MALNFKTVSFCFQAFQLIIGRLYECDFFMLSLMIVSIITLSLLIMSNLLISLAWPQIVMAKSLKLWSLAKVI